MRRAKPPILWVALCALAVMTAMQLSQGLHTNDTRLLLPAALGIVLLGGLYAGHTWAYVLTLVYCFGCVIDALAWNQRALPWRLIVTGLVAVPLLLCREYYRPPPSPNRRYCPRCGSRLPSPPETRCPECGAGPPRSA